MRTVLAAGLLWLHLAGTAFAHPFHASYAELERGAGGTLDVALQVIPEDLEQALTEFAGRRLVLADSPAVRRVLQQYLSARFRLLADGGPAPLSLVGMELGYRDTWLYFTLAADPAGAELENTLLFEVADAQSNRVRCLWTPRSPALVFNAGEPRRRLPIYTPDQETATDRTP
jgi:hypothetical protein